jgi:hypothetical protein
VGGNSRWPAEGAVEERVLATSEACGTPVELGEALVGPKADQSGLAMGSVPMVG